MRHAPQSATNLWPHPRCPSASALCSAHTQCKLCFRAFGGSIDNRRARETRLGFGSSVRRASSPQCGREESPTPACWLPNTVDYDIINIPVFLFLSLHFIIIRQNVDVSGPKLSGWRFSVWPRPPVMSLCTGAHLYISVDKTFWRGCYSVSPKIKNTSDILYHQDPTRYLSVQVVLVWCM